MIESKIWCNKCGYKKISQRHHIVPQSYFKQNHLPIDNTKKNTSDLCDLCHFLTPFLDGYEEIDKWK